MSFSSLQRLLPSGATDDAARLVTVRGLRGFADGMVSVLLAAYLSDLGFSPGQVGVLVTATLLGSAALTLGVGLFGTRLTPRQVLLGACALMLITGIGFAGLTSFWPLLLVAIVGTLNPSGGDVSVFLPTEQSLLTSTVPRAGTHRPVRALQPVRHVRRRPRRPMRRRPRPSREGIRHRYRRCPALRLCALCRRRCNRRDDLPARYGGEHAAPRHARSAAGEVPRHRPPAFGRVLPSIPSAAASSCSPWSCCGYTSASTSP